LTKKNVFYSGPPVWGGGPQGGTEGKVGGGRQKLDFLGTLKPKGVGKGKQKKIAGGKFGGVGIEPWYQIVQRRVRGFSWPGVGGMSNWGFSPRCVGVAIKPLM